MVYKPLQNQYRLLKVDELTIDTHFHLRPDDECYYLMEYKIEDGYENQEKQLVFNFKKKPELINTSQWPHKLRAISSLAEMYASSVAPFFNGEPATFVPIPPSKCKADPNYDDRLTQLLQRGFPQGSDIRELFVNRDNIRSSHENPQNRPSPQELIDNMILDPAASANLSEKVVLFDDVLTSGAHFRACKQMIQNRFPETIVVGVFISRIFWPKFDPRDFDLFFPDLEEDF